MGEAQVPDFYRCRDYWEEGGEKKFSEEGWLTMAEEVKGLVREGKNVIISGPNKTGKTELWRYLGADPSLDLVVFDVQGAVGGWHDPTLDSVAEYLLEQLEKQEKTADFEGIVSAIGERAAEAKSQGKRLVLFCDEWNYLTRFNNPELLKLYLGLARQIGKVENAVGVHVFISKAENYGLAAGECLPESNSSWTRSANSFAVKLAEKIPRALPVNFIEGEELPSAFQELCQDSEFTVIKTAERVLT